MWVSLSPYDRKRDLGIHLKFRNTAKYSPYRCYRGTSQLLSWDDKVHDNLRRWGHVMVGIMERRLDLMLVSATPEATKTSRWGKKGDDGVSSCCA